jgi:hypothetical protein
MLDFAELDVPPQQQRTFQAPFLTPCWEMISQDRERAGTLPKVIPSGRFSLYAEPIPDDDPNRITFRVLNLPRTARIICKGAVYIKARRADAL